MEDIIMGAVAQRRFVMQMLVAFSVIATGLSLFGLYAVVSYSISQRSRELGIRVALGATERRILVLVMADGMRMTAIGMTIGVIAALSSSSILRSQVFGVRPFDLKTVGVVLFTMAVITGAAIYPPARRAGRIDPIEALRTGE
jgi:ABC-type antimicrobial peptide transport system permease subunit